MQNRQEIVVVPVPYSWVNGPILLRSVAKTEKHDDDDDDEVAYFTVR